ncbi:hydroxymethylbilane synthase [Nocardia brasiliensis]|uniref:hydroxymethylbilane synthase n=1 Tax=Nocardia brasiliensis TaxID=37326 RepID=UPI00366A66DB
MKYTDEKIRLGTRGSKLAVCQSMWVADRFTRATGVDVHLVTVSTEGDESARPIEQLGSTGVFVTALRHALLRGDIDFVVHSYKDLPSQPEPELCIPAIPTREDPRDALVWPGGAPGAATLENLPADTRVGTGSPRRVAQLHAVRPDVPAIPIRGNLDTRLRKASDGTVDAVILAMAGLSRLGRLDAFTSPLPATVLLPAPAQGALALECRADDARTRELLSTLDDPATRAVVTAEREFLRILDAGCSKPVAALGQLAPKGDRLRIDGMVADTAGTRILRGHLDGARGTAAELGRRLAEQLLDQGARELLTDRTEGATHAR